MDRPKLEVGDIFRRYGEAYRDKHGASMSPAQRRVMTALELCRTAALGGHLEQCDGCGHERNCYNSCADRHCPKCQSLARAQWIEDRQSELLEVPYFHVVYTMPAEIAAIAYQNKEVVYGILFQATAETMRTIAIDPQHLGAEIGFFAVLHTWGQALQPHPHLHCVVPSGFQRIRYYGFLGNRYRQQKLDQCRRLLGMPMPDQAPAAPVEPDYRDRYEDLTGASLRQCPQCQRGRMIPVALLPRSPRSCIRFMDSS